MCDCSCHRGSVAGGMCICCADGGVTKLLEPPSAEDKSAELMKKILKQDGK